MTTPTNSEKKCDFCGKPAYKFSPTDQLWNCYDCWTGTPPTPLKEQKVSFPITQWPDGKEPEVKKCVRPYCNCDEVFCKTQTKAEIGEWEKDFDEKFGSFSTNVNKKPLTSREIKSFIRSLLSSHEASLRSSLVKEIEKMKKEIPLNYFEDEVRDGWNSALNSIKNLINK
jgi:hypothetical protein